MYIANAIQFDKLYNFAIKKHGYIKLTILLLFMIGCKLIYGKCKILYEIVIRCLDHINDASKIIFLSSLQIIIIGAFLIFISVVIYILLFFSKDSGSQKLEAENAKLRERVKELENTTQAGGGDDIPYTLWREVLAMKGAGMTDKQIAVKLYDKGQGASKAQLGALLYSGKSKIPAQKTLQDYGTELFR